jgi:hypothetical protein
MHSVICRYVYIFIYKIKTVWSCDISIVRELYMEQEKTYIRGSKNRKLNVRAKKILTS